MALISCRDLCLAYEGKIAVRDLSFDVLPGDYLCIVGENGSGKSTLIKALLGLKKPRSGSIQYGDGLRRREIGYLPQQTPAQKDFPASVREVVLSGCRATPFFAPAEKRRAEENMEKLGLTELRRACYRDLSGGQQQRVLLARALCATRKLLLLDEPVTGLDPTVSAELYRIIQDLNDEGVTVIMVSHDVDCAIERAKKILHLRTVPLFFGNSGDYRMSEIGRSFMAGRPEKGGEDA
jgi:zinc transport system ATP-binding protein